MLIENRWEHFDHESDIGVCGYGRTMEQAFQQAAKAFTAVMCDVAAVAPVETREIRCNEPDPELLLSAWLGELLFFLDVENLVFSEFRVNIDGSYNLAGTARGSRLDPERHSPTVQVKGVTYSELKVARRDNGCWIAQCVLDV